MTPFPYLYNGNLKALSRGLLWLLNVLRKQYVAWTFKPITIYLIFTNDTLYFIKETEAIKWENLIIDLQI